MTDLLLGLVGVASISLIGVPAVLTWIAAGARRRHEAFAAWAADAGLAPEVAPRPLPGVEATPHGHPTRFAGEQDGVPTGARLVASASGTAPVAVQVWAAGPPPGLSLGRTGAPARAVDASLRVPLGAPRRVPLDTGDPEIDATVCASAPLSPALLSCLDAPTRRRLLELVARDDAAVEGGCVVTTVRLAIPPDEIAAAQRLVVSLARALAGAPDGDAAGTAARLHALATADPVAPVRARAAAALAVLARRGDPDARRLADALAGDPDPLVALPCAAAVGDLARFLAAGDAPGAPAALAARLLADDQREAGDGRPGAPRLGPPDGWLDWLGRRLAGEAADGWARGDPSPAAHHGPLLDLAAGSGDLRLLAVLGPLADDPMLPSPDGVRDALAAIRARAGAALVGSVALADDAAGTLALATGGAGRVGIAADEDGRPRDGRRVREGS